MRLQFDLETGSFGEVYHVLAAAYLSHLAGVTLPVRLSKRPDAQELFALLRIKTAECDPQFGAQPLPRTADIICNYFQSGCLEPLADEIRRKAEKEGWSPPHPELRNTERKMLIWQRDRKDWKKHRNSTEDLVNQLACLCLNHRVIPVTVVGHKHSIPGAVELGNFYDDPFFTGGDTIAKELWFLDTLFRSFGAIASVGMMSGALDGPAMIFGHKTIFFASGKDATPRMKKISKSVPNLIWQRTDYEGDFHELTDSQLHQLEQRLFSR